MFVVITQTIVLDSREHNSGIRQVNKRCTPRFSPQTYFSSTFNKKKQGKRKTVVATVINLQPVRSAEWNDPGESSASRDAKEESHVGSKTENEIKTF